MSDAQRHKHASAKAYYGFDIIGLEPTETITACSATVSPSGLTLSGPVVIASPRVSQLVTGGTAGTDYNVRFHITTNLGYEDDFDYSIKVIA